MLKKGDSDVSLFRINGSAFLYPIDVKKSKEKNAGTTLIKKPRRITLFIKDTLSTILN